MRLLQRGSAARHGCREGTRAALHGWRLELEAPAPGCRTWLVAGRHTRLCNAPSPPPTHTPTLAARFLVSARPKPQNWLPVHDTMPRISRPVWQQDEAPMVSHSLQ